MKKLCSGRVVLVAACIVFAFSVAHFSYAMTTGEGNSNAKLISYDIVSKINRLDVKWKKKSGVDYWILLRADVTKQVSSDFASDVKKSEYKRIAKVSGRKKAYSDKAVKHNHVYAYILKGYKKNGHKKIVIYKSFMDGITQFNCPGLARPRVINGGNGEFYSNSNRKIYLFIDSYCGMAPKGVIFYRKESGEKKYKKINLKAVEPMETAGVYLDSNVKAGKKYRYFVKTYIKVGKRTYYSRKSKPISLKAEAPSPSDDDL